MTTVSRYLPPQNLRPPVVPRPLPDALDFPRDAPRRGARATSLPSVTRGITRLSVGTTSIPIAVGLILMMYPPLAKVKYEELPEVFRNTRVLALSLVQNWIIGPLLMFGLALAFLSDKPEYAIGLIMIGLARCIAMVIVWNELAKGDTEYAAGLVAFNSVFQVLFYSVYAWLFVKVLPPLVGVHFGDVDLSRITIGAIAESVFIYLGIPFLAGMLTRLRAREGQGPRRGMRREFIPTNQPDHARLAPLHHRRDVLAQGRVHRGPSARRGAHRPAAPHLLRRDVPRLVLHGPASSGPTTRRRRRSPSRRRANNFELAIAVAVAVFGINSGAAFAAVIGPLVEVPVLIGLVNVALYFQRRYFEAGRPEVVDVNPA